MVYFDYELKEKFDSYDIDKSGTISRNELSLLLKDTFDTFIKELDVTLPHVLENCLDEVALKMIKSLDKDGSATLGWNEFKEFMTEFTKQQSFIMDLIKRAKASSY